MCVCAVCVCYACVMCADVVAASFIVVSLTRERRCNNGQGGSFLVTCLAIVIWHGGGLGSHFLFCTNALFVIICHHLSLFVIMCHCLSSLALLAVLLQMGIMLTVLYGRFSRAMSHNKIFSCFSCSATKWPHPQAQKGRGQC